VPSNATVNATFFFTLRRTAAVAAATPSRCAPVVMGAAGHSRAASSAGTAWRLAARLGRTAARTAAAAARRVRMVATRRRLPLLGPATCHHAGA